ncbi:MAG: PBP1A family penicillin-binding protein [Thermodesulfobacteriota bacterium]|nr:PBP1A family penicillin-binding protein [Thermodesulfobacteriota bacterium]
MKKKIMKKMKKTMNNKQQSVKDIEKKKTKKGKFVKRIFLWIFALALLLTLAGAGFIYFLVDGLPSISSLKDYRPSIITRVYADNNQLIDEFYLEDRKIVQVTDLPKFVIQAFVAAEDARFFRHKGIDINSIIRAFFKNMEAGTIVQGGSTITQQVAKSLFLSPEKKYIRKLKEAILAYRIDKYLKKYEILNLYLNHIYLGHGAYGIETASQHYFGKTADKLTLPEAALLAGLPKAPSRYSPSRHPERAHRRQIYVLNRMAEDGYITGKEKMAAIEVPVELKKAEGQDKIAPYFTENVRRYIQTKYGSDVLYREGLEVYTTLDVTCQKAASNAVARGLRDLDKRQGYRGVLKRVPEEDIESFVQDMKVDMDKPLEGRIVKAIVVDVDSEEKIVRLRVGKYEGIMTLKNMSWARVPDPKIAYNTAKVKDPADVLKTGDVVEVKVLNVADGKLELALEQEPLVQGALLAMDSNTGEIKAMVGGRSYKKSEFNRATQSKRQPGSAFKPFIFTAAFDKGMTPATIIMDSPVIYRDTLKDSLWKPQNYSEKFYGPTPLRTALIKSRNLVTIKLLKEIGVNYAADYAANMGIITPLTRDLSMALGTSGVTLLEMVRGYGIFANGGKRVKPFFIKKIVDRTGNIVEENVPEVAQAVDPGIAYITSHLLQEVVKGGTGWRVRALGRPVAGKTGTTNNLKDAWFMGFTPSLAAGVWVGFDDLKPLGKYETGSRAASPIFLYFMEKALAGTPIESFSPPEGVVFAKIDPETGALAGPDSEKYIFECFLEGTEPTETISEDDGSEDKGFFRYDLDSGD